MSKTKLFSVNKLNSYLGSRYNKMNFKNYHSDIVIQNKISIKVVYK